MDSSHKTIKNRKDKRHSFLDTMQTRIWLYLSQQENHLCRCATEPAMTVSHSQICFQSSHSTKRPFCWCWWHRHAKKYLLSLKTFGYRMGLALSLSLSFFLPLSLNFLMKLMWTLGSTSVRLNTPLLLASEIPALL